MIVIVASPIVMRSPGAIGPPRSLPVDGDRIDAFEEIEVIPAVFFENAHVTASDAARAHDDFVAGGCTEGHGTAVDTMHLSPTRFLTDFKIQHMYVRGFVSCDTESILFARGVKDYLSQQTSLTHRSKAEEALHP